MKDIGYSATAITNSDAFQKYTSVTVKTGDGSDAKSYTASSENNNGRNLEVIIPFGNEETAQSILSKVNGFQYQPYTADGAIVDPAVEIGDGIKVAGTESSMFSQDMIFGGIIRSNISAPGEEEIDHEIEYIPHERRSVNRAINAVSGAVGAVSKELDDVEEEMQKVETGMSEIYDRDAAGNWKVGTKLDSRYIDPNTGGIKESIIGSSIVTINKKAYSLAEISADVVTIKGDFYFDKDGHVHIDSPARFGSNVYVIGDGKTFYANDVNTTTLTVDEKQFASEDITFLNGKFSVLTI